MASTGWAARTGWAPVYDKKHGKSLAKRWMASVVCCQASEATTTMKEQAILVGLAGVALLVGAYFYQNLGLLVISALLIAGAVLYRMLRAR
jgi:hypothetical protein